jgi:C-3',4' desaturase CrtD
MAKIIIIGAGIGGLTVGALLGKKGHEVVIFEQALMAGGCASTFKRKGFIFDVGATQVAGLEKDGIHHRIFSELGLNTPLSTPCDPACAVYLPEETEPINMWRDPQKWREERQRQFPHSEAFWQLLDLLFKVSWQFQGRDPVLPPRNFWDLTQLIQALRLNTLITVPFALMTVADALKLYGLYEDKRLKTFLDLQLKLYSQVNTDETALLYGATALAVSQYPQGLSHLVGSMQVLSDRLIEGLKKYQGKLLLGHKVEKIYYDNQKVSKIRIIKQKTGEILEEKADYIIANVPIQNLVKMMEDHSKNNQNNLLFNIDKNLYQKRVEKLIYPSGAFVIYLGVEETAIPENCPPHLQFFYDYNEEIGENNSLFISVSKPDDGRAPQGKRTIIASSFTNADQWWTDNIETYTQLKEKYTQKALFRLGQYFNLTPETIIHQEVATPRTFAYFTAREKGIVGGIGQRISTFGPFGITTRTPWENLFLVGDSTHPGEGTAGVSYSALTVVKQIEQFLC